MIFLEDVSLLIFKLTTRNFDSRLFSFFICNSYSIHSSFSFVSLYRPSLDYPIGQRYYIYLFDNNGDIIFYSRVWYMNKWINNPEYMEKTYMEFYKHLIEYKNKNLESNNNTGLYLSEKYYDNLKEIKLIKDLKDHLGL